ncbi:hypothetical protein STAQ_28040 [Allostella sp. ATCC 35155]|nr:hypothetical protein STAQ_28040 [Stella sp. ATCC 35155]
MEDLVLRAKLDDGSWLYVSPIGRDTYEEHVEGDNLGGDDGYFLLQSRDFGQPRLEVLAKATTFYAAMHLFDLFMAGRREPKRERQRW